MARILIAGAGIGGLTAALTLLRRGHEVHLFEQASELREVGAGVQLSANGTRVLIDLGLRARMEQVICEPAGKEIRLWSTGQSWKLFDLGETSVARYGAPYWMVHRGDFHAILRDAVQQAGLDMVRVGVAAEGFDQDDGGITLHLSSRDHVRGDLLIGADGVHSAIRQRMFGTSRAQFTGIMAWRGLIPMQRLPHHLRRLVGANWNGIGGHVVTYPLRRGEILNFVGARERDDWQVESWTEAGTIEECLRDFAGWHDDIQTIVRAIATPFKWALLGREPLPVLFHRPCNGDGRCRASDPAVPGTRCQHGVGRCHGAGTLPGRIQRCRQRAETLRRGATGADGGDRARIERQRETVP